jgi:hypothetical protein
MKKTIFITLLLVCGIVFVNAQTAPNPFGKYGFKKVHAYSFSRGEFEEFHDNQDVVEIGSVLFDTKTNQVVGYAKEEVDSEVDASLPAMSIDPMCEKYPWISPYAYCNNNPVRFVDLHGDSLTYYGDAQAAVDAHNVHLGGYYTTTVDNNGLVSMNPVSGMDLSKMTPEQQAYADALGAVVNGTDGMTTINVVNGDNGVQFGDITTATIDIGDIGALPTAELAPITSGSVLIHEVTEQYNMQVKVATLDPRNPGLDAHKKAARVEGTVIQQRLGVAPDREFIPSSPSSTSGYMDINSSNGKARVYIRNNNVVGVSYYK